MPISRHLSALALLALPAPAAAAPAPRVHAASFAELAQPLPYPYDELADANHVVAAARARARASGKLLLIDFGGNWCADCRILSGVMAPPEIRAFIARNYEVALVDICRMDRNQQIPAHYGIPRLEGVPAVLIVDPRTDRPLNRDHVFALADARTMTPQALADWLARWTRR
jgi:thiol-disulfide isomerase/thioredoxin